MPKKPKGIAEIPAIERTAYGDVVKGDTLIEVLKVKAAKPLASHGLIAELLGISYSTVSAALATPYAQRQLAAMPTGIPQLANRLHETQADGVEYYAKSVRVGNLELEKGPKASPHLLTNAREVLQQVGKATGLLKDTLRLESKTESEQDYATLQELTSDPALAVLAETVMGDSVGKTQEHTSTPQAVTEQGNVKSEQSEQDQEPGERESGLGGA